MRVETIALLAGLGQFSTAGVVWAETPFGWKEYSVNNVSIALPTGWEASEEGEDFLGAFFGDMSKLTGYGFGLAFDVDATSYLNDVTSIPAGSETFDGVSFDRYTFTADDGQGMLGEGEIFISTDPVVGEDRVVLLLSALNVTYADQEPLFDEILATVDLPGDGGVAAPVADPAALAAEVATAPAEDGMLGRILTVNLPEGWHSFGEDETQEVGLLPVAADGIVTLARGEAARALIAEAPDPGAATEGSVLGLDSWQISWPGTLPEFSDGATFKPGTYRLHVLKSCLPGDEPVAVLIGGIDRFHKGVALKALLAGLTLSLPEGTAPCPVSVLGGPPEPVAKATPKTTPETVPKAAPALAPDAVAVVPPPTAALPAPPAPASVYPEDSFIVESADWSLYQNGRFGTFVSYPSAYFVPDLAPDNGDGRSFASVDGQASFYIFAQWNAFGLDQPGMIAQDKALLGAHRQLTYEDGGAGWYVLSGLQGSDIFYRRVLFEGPNGLNQTFEILYPAARKAEFDPIVTYMASTFGPGTSWGEADTGGMEANSGSYVDIAALHTPARGTAERDALMDAARGPVEALLDMPVIFVVSTLRSDGAWAFLQAQPRNPDGSEIDWSRTPLAADWQNGFMSDIVMVLMTNDGSGWAVADYVVGPTDVYWYSWIDGFGLPEALFQPG